ncbi:MAG TPA: molybdopterin cofactor-binding domain-containing protein [Terriglobales bacterium]|nr:molybdopterin cofactor-binding domain-containing protein [Terriglobales bacterium]
MYKKTFLINGVERTLLVEGTETLAAILRERLLLTGCKIGCGEGHCGACNVILNGKLTRSCITKVGKLDDFSTIETIEGIGTVQNLHPLQVAWMAYGCAQCGFCSPGFIVSAKALLDSNKSPTREEVRSWFDKNRNLCRCTGYKPLIDAVMAAAAVMRGEMSKEDLMFSPVDNKIIGTTFVRPSAAMKVTGTWDFGADEALHMPEDTLRLALVQAEVSHANIRGVDTSEAEKMPGVFKVITAKDVPGKNRINGLVMLPYNNKCDGWDRPILCDEKVFQYGDAVAIVAADTEAHARAAAKAVKLDLEVLPAYMSAPEALAPDAIEIHPGVPNAYFENNCIKGPDFDFDLAPNVAEVESYCSRQPHLYLEPDNGYAYTDEDGMLTVHSKSIGIHLHMAMIADGVGVPMDKLRIVQNNAGGTFGYKFSPTNEAILGVAALVTKRPVSLNFNMYQSITYTGKRSPGHMHVKLAADEKGKLLGLWGNNYIDHGPYSEFGDLLTHRLSQFTGAGYHIPTIRNKNTTVFTNHAWGSAFRSYGSPQAYMGSELAIDVLAAQMGLDPFDIREMNCYKESEGSTIPTGFKPDVYCEEGLFKLARPKYEEAKKRVAAKNAASDGKVKHGVGVSLGVYGCGLDGVDSSEAWVDLNPDGTVTVRNSWEDHGQGADIGTLTAAHETLRTAGFTPDRIKLDLCDTKRTPNSGPAGGSRSAVMTGNAIRLACEKLLEGMKKPSGGWRTYDEMKAEGVDTHCVGKWVATYCSANPIDQATSQGEPFSVYMYTIFLPEVAVDTETGKVTVEKFTAVADCGTILNRLAVDGNFYGGLAQGIGLALSEDFEDLKKHTTLLRCGIPYAKDVPDDMEILYLETPRPEGPYGAAGCGEAPLDAPHPAILNAIFNATGVRITRVPALPEVVLEALKKAH